MTPPPELKQAERLGEMNQQMKDMAGDIHDLKIEQERQGERQAKQGEVIASLNIKMIVAGSFGGLGGSLLVGLLLILVGKGTP